MRFNDKDMTDICQRPSHLEGRLHHRAPSGSFRDSGFRERFFKLVGNLLFYFRISELGKIEDKEPMGVIVLENYAVHAEPESISFAFAIVFMDESEKKHVFTARTEDDMEHWIKTLSTASYQYWKNRYNSLKSHIDSTIANRITTIQNAPSTSSSRSCPEKSVVSKAGLDEDLIKF